MQITRPIPFFLIGFLCLAGSSLVHAQGAGGGGGGGGGQAPVQQPVEQPVPVDTGDTVSSGTADNEGPVDFDDSADLDFGGDSTNRRNQGFIGATGERIGELGFTGAASDLLGPPLDTEGDGSIGGGVNNQIQLQIPSAGQSGFQAPQPNGVVIVRRSLRARLRPSFYAPTIPATTTISRFSRNFSRQPTTVGLANRFSISIANKTATVSGTVDNADQMNRIIRQLRLQPGVYKIDNRLRVMN